MASQAENKSFGWKKYRRTCELIVERSMAMERNRTSYQTREEGRNREDTKMSDRPGSDGSYMKVKTKAVAVQKQVECIFCLQDQKENSHYPLSSQYCHSIASTPEQLQKIIRHVKVCPTCLQDHGPQGECNDKTRQATPRSAGRGARWTQSHCVSSHASTGEP